MNFMTTEQVLKTIAALRSKEVRQHDALERTRHELDHWDDQLEILKKKEAKP